MKVGVVKELKQGEGRVACTPENVRKLTEAGHEVVVEKNAGVGSGFTDEMYQAEGGTIVTHEQAWEADLVIKVKEPHESEYKFFKKDQIIWGFLHLASSKEIVEKMQSVGMTAISGETIIKDGKAELLAPMSAIAGQRSAIMGAYYSEAQHGGQGTLVTGVKEIVDIPSSTYVIFGGGVAATNAANIALGLNAKVIIIELNDDRIEYLKSQYAGKDVEVVKSTPENLSEQIKKADVFISTILIPGAKPPKLVKREMVQSMKKGSVIIDIAIDQGGTVETIRPTTISDPIYIEEGVIHYGVPNQPGAVPRTSTMALAQGNIDYLLEICNKGLEQAIKDNQPLSTGVNVYKGQVTNKGLADSHDMEYKEILNVIA
ncbi:alanine dehydrogenase [Macrococcus capreoli]|uniref:alanine dehydrogenase n=1 Tax=Macrococcus capreoli TaxID=2982690 RepID=UPI0021D597BA|nr:alanine dehydrogenase [Macrococcus sp. TMW 2.2395]MCU7558396.1 alanine dehydrogenase [Macrococcus sp. TMW 2.2395]